MTEVGIDTEYDHKTEPVTIRETNPVGSVKLPCGCWVVAEHGTGERAVGCGGGGERWAEVEGQRGLSKLVCPGGRGYVLTAVPQPPTYEVRAVKIPGMNDDGSKTVEPEPAG